jgi:hypothetical protein
MAAANRRVRATSASSRSGSEVASARAAGSEVCAAVVGGPGCDGDEAAEQLPIVGLQHHLGERRMDAFGQGDGGGARV